MSKKLLIASLVAGSTALTAGLSVMEARAENTPEGLLVGQVYTFEGLKPVKGVKFDGSEIQANINEDGRPKKLWLNLNGSWLKELAKRNSTLKPESAQIEIENVKGYLVWPFKQINPKGDLINPQRVRLVPNVPVPVHYSVQVPTDFDVSGLLQNGIRAKLIAQMAGRKVFAWLKPGGILPLPCLFM